MTDHISPQDKFGLQLAAYPHRFTIETRSSDCFGSTNHIPNGKISEYGDDARLGIHLAIMGSSKAAATQLVEARFQYLVEVTFPGKLDIGVGIVGLGRSSIKLIAGYFRDDRCYVLANFVLVKTVDGASAPLTAEERLRATPFLIGDAVASA